MKTIKIQLPELTGQENTAYNLNGAGLQTKEIADRMGLSYETVKSYMKAIKQKLGLSKDKEITAHFFCRVMDKDFAEVKRQIIASILLVLFIVMMPFDFSPKKCARQRLSVRRTKICRRNDYTTT